jgi:hypothetical protein
LWINNNNIINISFPEKIMKYCRNGSEKEKGGCDCDISTTLKFKPCPRHHTILLEKEIDKSYLVRRHNQPVRW